MSALTVVRKRAMAKFFSSLQIMALSKHHDTPIHILQAGSPLVKVGEEIKSGRGPLLISYVFAPSNSEITSLRSPLLRYHRKMYGLGEVSDHILKRLETHTDVSIYQHYNSLLPKTAITPLPVVI